MPTFVRRNGVLVDKRTGEPMHIPDRDGPQAPMVMKPMPAYQSPIDDRPINSRQERKDDLKRHGCIEWDDSLSPTKGKIKDKAWAAKRGLEVSEEYR